MWLARRQSRMAPASCTPCAAHMNIKSIPRYFGGASCAAWRNKISYGSSALAALACPLFTRQIAKGNGFHRAVCVPAPQMLLKASSKESRSQVHRCPTMRAPDAGESARFRGIFSASAFFSSDGGTPSAPAQVTLTVGPHAYFMNLFVVQIVLCVKSCFANRAHYLFLPATN
jgi:hypothetical protein